MNQVRTNNKLQLRTQRTRGKLAGKAQGRHRISVFRSNKFLYAQLIAPNGATITSIKGIKPGEVGQAMAKKASEAGVKTIVFDRGGYRYHGKVKLMAEALRAGGLEF